MVKLVKLFPQYMLLPAVGGIALLAAAGYMVKRGISFWLALAVLVIGFAILYILALSYGVSALQNRLAWLYQNLEPERFLESLKSFCPVRKRHPRSKSRFGLTWRMAMPRSGNSIRRLPCWTARRLLRKKANASARRC